MTFLRAQRALGLLSLAVSLASCSGGNSTVVPAGSRAFPGGSWSKISTIVDHPLASQGCGRSSILEAGSSATFSFADQGIERTFVIHLSLGYRATRKTPLVLVFHGRGESLAQIQVQTGYSNLADRDGFIVTYPRGTTGETGIVGWATGGPGDSTIDDVRFVSRLLDALQSRFCIDPQRIFATGISNGGGMTAVLACRLSGRIASFVVVSGLFYPIPGACRPVRPVAIEEFHGIADPVVPYNPPTFAPFLSVPAWLSMWSHLDGCADKPERIAAFADVVQEAFPGCRPGGAVVHYAILDGQHT